jgi:hypothetical protein
MVHLFVDADQVVDDASSSSEHSRFRAVPREADWATLIWLFTRRTPSRSLIERSHVADSLATGRVETRTGTLFAAVFTVEQDRSAEAIDESARRMECQ